MTLLSCDFLIRPTCWTLPKALSISRSSISSPLDLWITRSTYFTRRTVVCARVCSVWQWPVQCTAQTVCLPALTLKIPTVKPTRRTNVSNLFYFGMTLYMFRTVFPSIIISSRLYIQQYLFDKCLLLYVQSWNADDGRKDRPKHVECHSKIK